ncbi:glycerol-3-phosphate acyltransferase [Solirubrobacter phytolaccae]|uniref:Glycerol-3-phosphate acyltransferase n=1 Tax=Solirubrobacter phytolaccae TaxID=1404360 RepID=A0A9X3SFH1_9ACTN|nr:glycerol-3-phosphate acyltransferase [Solirubrobacter phytolaccae]MDA0181517.1 glycerol-3-phosphate acyltransferase [Solirubrobacter phytolaccae]
MGYICGAIPVALLVARRHGVNLLATGDGNPGAWNALEQLGPSKALPAFLGDGAKALLPAAAAHLAFGFWPAFAAVAGAMVGHAFPLPHPGRGGKSIMCFVGGAFALSPLAAVACGALAIVVTVVTAFKYAARVSVFAFPLVQLLTDPVEHVIATGALMTFIGALFVTRRRTSAPASAATGAPPTT